MAEKPLFWNRHDEKDRLQFARLLDPLVLAAREKKFTKAEASVYMLTLQDVPREILALGVSRLIEQGVTWMPKPGDIKHACADIVDELRSTAARLAKALQDECPECRGTGWADAEGPNAVIRCRCVTRGLELLAEAGQAISRPMLPAVREQEPVA